MIGIYIHVPFCKSKCPYCDFYSVKPTEEIMDAYTDAVCNELKKTATGKNADTLYFGGGTPVLLGAKRIITILNAAQKIYGLNNAEVTIEANPNIDIDYKTLYLNGFNRISFGLQSALDSRLVQLGRTHSAKKAFDSVVEAQKYGFTNISLDMMLALPKQDIKEVQYTIDFCRNLNVSHISAYLLKIEPSTPFYTQNISLPNDDETAELYLFAVQSLEEAGYRQYEISNFAKDKQCSKHNLKYWNNQEYIGIGPSAHSFLENKRFFYKRDLKKFINSPTRIFDSTGGDFEEFLMLGLRLTDGIFWSDIPEKYFSHIKKRCAFLENHALINTNNLSFNLTPKGFLLSNSIIIDLISIP